MIEITFFRRTNCITTIHASPYSGCYNFALTLASILFWEFKGPFDSVLIWIWQISQIISEYWVFSTRSLIVSWCINSSSWGTPSWFRSQKASSLALPFPLKTSSWSGSSGPTHRSRMGSGSVLTLVISASIGTLTPSGPNQGSTVCSDRRFVISIWAVRYRLYPGRSLVLVVHQSGSNQSNPLNEVLLVALLLLSLLKLSWLPHFVDIWI